jgi:hypothetical protein
VWTCPWHTARWSSLVGAAEQEQNTVPAGGQCYALLLALLWSTVHAVYPQLHAMSGVWCALYAGTQYAGEMKKGVFTFMHYLMPKRGILSLHSGCNVGVNQDVTLFFGLSGEAGPRGRHSGFHKPHQEGGSWAAWHAAARIPDA